MSWKLFAVLSIMAFFAAIEGFSQALDQPESPLPRIVFYRNTGAIKSAATCKVYAGDSLLAKVNTKSAWTTQLPPGDYIFQTVLSLENERGKTLSLTLERGKLYLIEINLQGSGHQQAIPSAGYSFRLEAIAEKRYKSLLRKKTFSEALRQALYEELKTDYQLD